MIDTLLQSDVTARLGMVLLHFVWQGFAIGALLAVCLAALGAQANRAKYAAAVGALILLAASPAVTWWLVPSNSLPVVEITADVEAERPESDAAGTPPEALDRGGDAATQFVPRQEASIQQRVRMSLLRFGGFMVGLAPWLALLWMLGAAVLSANLIGGFLTLRRRRLGAALATTDLRHLCTALAKRMGTRVDVELRVSSRIDSPCTFGLFRPVILLPVSLATGHPVERLELILAHELAHIRRHDYAVSVLQAVTETLLFYHPVVWWVSAVTRREREYICDSVALEATGAKRADYIETLLSLEKARASLSLAASEAPLLARVRRILGAPPRSSMAPAPLVPVMVLGLLFALTMGLVLAQGDLSESDRVTSDSIAENVARSMIPPIHFISATVVGDVQWRDDYSHLDPDRWTTFDDDAYVLLEERSPAFTRTGRVWQDEEGLAYRVTVPRDAESLDPDEAGHWLDRMLDQTYNRAPVTYGTRRDSAWISVLRGEDVADLRQQVLRLADGLSFSEVHASQAIQLHSADLVDDAFLAEVVRTSFVTINERLPPGSAERRSRLGNHVPWLYLTALEVEDEELRLELLSEIAQFASLTGEEVSESVPVPVYDSAGRIVGWDVAPNN